jgi:hypothetical protein
LTNLDEGDMDILEHELEEVTDDLEENQGRRHRLGGRQAWL